MGPVMIISILVGIILGAAAAWYRESSLDTGMLLLAFSARSVPIFFGGLILLIIFSHNLDLLPSGRMRTTTFEGGGFVETFISWDYVRHATLPTITGVLYYIALPLLLMRNTMLEIIGDEFLEVLKAKGLSERAVLFKHAVRNSLLPVITASSLMIGYAVGGQVVLETVFSWPGMGTRIIEAINQNDYPVAQGIFLLMASLVILLNLLADILYVVLDPRVSYDEI